jgi:adenine-specific DNA-methyltransferase
MRVLDPGAGTGEFLATCAQACDGLDLHGWDLDGRALAVARRLCPEARLEVRDALLARGDESFDAVVGNPPYFEVRGRTDLRRKYRDVIGGRPNVFAMFFAAGLAALKPGGLLGFVVPPSMNHGAYFEKLRRYLLERAAILHLSIEEGSDHFEEAQQAVQLLVLRKGASSRRHLFRASLGGAHGAIPNERWIFSEAPARLRAFFRGRKTLHELGYEATTGTVVWNQHRANLRRRPEPGAAPLLWAQSIGEGRLRRLPENGRLPYVVGMPTIEGPAIVVNRVTGAVGGGTLRAALVGRGVRFVGENHVNVIRARAGATPTIPWRRLLECLRAPGLQERVRALTGNTQISATELNHLLPLDA